LENFLSQIVPPGTEDLVVQQFRVMGERPTGFLIVAGIFLLPAVQSWLLPLFWFAAKTGSILFLFMWVRATLPRFRYDQLMGFTWKFLFPVAMLNLLVTSFLVAWFTK